MTKEQLQDTLAWMQDLQSDTLFNPLVDFNVEVNCYREDWSDLVLKIWVNQVQKWAYFTIDIQDDDDKALATKVKVYSYLQQFGIKLSAL